MWTNIRSSLLALALLLGAARPALAQEAPDSDALHPLRERFRLGMEKYRAGAYAEAIVVWEAIYRELGAEQGYRLAFNLGHAYEEFGDRTRAAEHFEAYLKETIRRTAAGEVLEPAVRKQADEAKERLAALPAPVRPPAVDVPQEKPVVVAPPPPVRFVLREERPFDRTILIVAAGVSVASIIVPVLFLGRATSTEDDYYGANPAAETEIVRLEADYYSARSAYYTSLAIPIALGVVTAGLAAYWYLGKTTSRVPVTAHSVFSGRLSW